MRKAVITLLSAGTLVVAAATPTQAQANSGSDSADFWGGWISWLAGWGNHSDRGHDRDRDRSRVPTLRGTKCWKFQAAFGKPAFMELHFFNRRHGHSLVSGQVVRADGVNKKPDRVLQISGSAGYNTYTSTVPVLDGEGNPVVENGKPKTEAGPEVERFLLDLTYSFSKTGTNLDNAFAEASLNTRGHYAVRLNADSLDGVFAGNDFIMRWAPPLTGPNFTLNRDETVTGGAGVTANYMGGINCEGGSCGVILPLNNAGTLELVGNSKRQCDNAREQFGPDF